MLPAWKANELTPALCPCAAAGACCRRRAGPVSPAALAAKMAATMCGFRVRNPVCGFAIALDSIFVACAEATVNRAGFRPTTGLTQETLRPCCHEQAARRKQ